LVGILQVIQFFRPEPRTFLKTVQNNSRELVPRDREEKLKKRQCPPIAYIHTSIPQAFCTSSKIQNDSSALYRIHFPSRLAAKIL
jgi:hypothetical protein